MKIYKQVKENRMIEIDLETPQGSPAALLYVAKKLSKSLGLNTNNILTEMKNDNCKNIVDIFNHYFENYVILYNK